MTRPRACIDGPASLVPATASGQLALWHDPRERSGVVYSAEQALAAKTLWETSERQLRPILQRLAKRCNGGHWVEPCAGAGAIPRLCMEILPELGRPLPVLWTVYEIGDASRCLAELSTEIGSSGRSSIHTPCDFLGLTNAHAATDVAMVITNLPWPEPGLSIVRKAFHLYEYADVLCLTDMVPFLRDWKTEGGPRAQWLAEHQPDWYVLPGRNSGARANTFAGATDEYAAPLAWMHWPSGQRDRTRGGLEILTP